MTTAFGTPFLLQERTLYSISDYQTGRCLSAFVRRDHDRQRLTSWTGHVLTNNIPMQEFTIDPRAVMWWTHTERECANSGSRSKSSLYTFEAARLSTFSFLTEQRKNKLSTQCQSFLFRFYRDLERKANATDHSEADALFNARYLC